MSRRPVPDRGHALDVALAAVLPLVAAAADRTEREGRLAALDTLLAAGLFRMLMPRSVAGLELDPAQFLTVLEQLGAADASTAWCVCQTSVCSMAAALLRDDVARTIFGDERAILAWGFGTEGRAIPCEGGWHVSGQWSFGSGSHHATWLGGTCTVCDADGTPVRDPSGRPISRMMLFPQDSAVFEPSWDVIGLRGTGSDTYGVAGLWVPDAASFQFGDPLSPHAGAALYRMPFDSLWAAGFASVALGAARGMLDALVLLAKAKTARASRHILAAAPATQAAVAEAAGALRAAGLFLHAAIGSAVAEAAEHGAVSLGGRMDIRLAASHAFRAARAAGEALYHAAGSSAVFSAGPFERRLRDLHTISQHVHGRQQHMEVVGQFLLGQPVGLQFL